jgi:hypothetical protein
MQVKAVFFVPLVNFVRNLFLSQDHKLHQGHEDFVAPSREERKDAQRFLLLSSTATVKHG